MTCNHRNDGHIQQFLILMFINQNIKNHTFVKKQGHQYVILSVLDDREIHGLKQT